MRRYLQAVSELDVDLKKVKFYAYGPRTFLEVSKVQILNFVCKVRYLFSFELSFRFGVTLTESERVALVV